MKTQLIAQPFKDNTSLLAVLSNWLSNPLVSRLDIAVAWAKRSGFRLIQSEVESFRGRGGELHLTVGIDAGGATRQGLELALDLATTCVIFHHSSSRTFHPKIYLATGEGIGEAVIGSQNLTRGGLVENFEAGLHILFDREIDTDRQQLDSLKNLFYRYRNAGNCSLQLDPESLSQLLKNPAYEIADEDSTPQTNRERGGSAASKTKPIFGRGDLDLINASKGMVAPGSTSGRTSSSPKKEPGSYKTTQASTARGNRVSGRWFKKMSAADAQWPEGSNTNPTGHLTLVQAKHPINRSSWFKDAFFGDENWKRVGKGKESTSVPFDVTILGTPYGVHSLNVTHTPTFEAGQSNRTTVLHWGTDVGAILRAQNLKGNFVSLERLSDGTFNLVVAEAPSGPFVDE